MSVLDRDQLSPGENHICYVEHHGRRYRAVTVPDFPRRGDGKPFRCIVRDRLRRVEVSERVPRDERARLIAFALTGDAGAVWSLVPVVGATAGPRGDLRSSRRARRLPRLRRRPHPRDL